MAIITMVAVMVLVVTLLVKFTIEQQRDYPLADEKTEMQENNLVNKDKAGKETNVVIPSSDLGQPSCQTGISEFHNPPNFPAEYQHKLQVQLSEEIGRAQGPIEQDIEMEPRLALQGLILQNVAAEGPVENMKGGVKVACLVISVSTTGIISFLAGVPKSHSFMTSKLILKSGILSMFASLISALVLLVLSTNKAKVSCSNQTLRIITWVSTGLMTLAIVLLMAFYFVQT